MAEASKQLPSLNPNQGLRFQASVEPATMKEISLFAVGQLYDDEELFSFDTTGTLFGVTEARTLQPITSELVPATIQLGELTDIKLKRDRFNRSYTAAVNLGGVAICNFEPTETFDAYRDVMPTAARSGTIELHYVAVNKHDAPSSYLKMTFDKK